MKIVTVKFLVENDEEAGLLIHEITESIGNGTGYPFISTHVEETTEDEVKKLAFDFFPV